MNKDIYMLSQDGEITPQYVREKLALSGISKGDSVMVSARLPFLGVLPDNKTFNDFSNMLIHLLLEAVGKEGTIAVPAYSYSFCGKQEFNVHATPSTLGEFFETFRQMEGVVRTIDPIFSVCIKGAKAGFLSAGDQTDCFGPDSFFARFHSIKDSKYLLIGLNYHYITSIHYIEQSNNISYRYIKEFPGTIVMPDDGKVERLQKYFVRSLDQFYDFRPLFSYMDDNGIGKTLKFGNSTMKIISDNVFHATVTRLLKSNERYMLAGTI